MQINVQAVFQGQAAVTTIVQSNVMTMAQAGAVSGGAGTSASGSGGLSNAAIGGIAGGVGAGALAAAVVLGGDPEPAGPALGITVAGGSRAGIRDVTQFSLSVTGGKSASADYAWDFGDGTTAAGNAASHVFSREGSFTVRISGRGSGVEETASITVTIGSLDGEWVEVDQGVAPYVGVTFTHRLRIVQQGQGLGGTLGLGARTRPRRSPNTWRPGRNLGTQRYGQLTAFDHAGQ
jgi:hypothetical protein